MKKYVFTQIFIALLLLLFIYTSTSKFLDYDKFVFQMRLAPIPFMHVLAPILGWGVPIVEMIIGFSLAAGFFYNKIKMIGLYASVILLSAFEIYIGLMLLSGSQLPCTCGGIISSLGWKEHLFFNAFFITVGIFVIRYHNKRQSIKQITPDFQGHKILSRA